MLKFAKILVFSLFAAPQRLPCDYHVSRMREVIALIEPLKIQSRLLALCLSPLLSHTSSSYLF